MSIRFKSWAGWFGLAVVLCSCAPIPTPQQAADQVTAAPICCKSLADLPYEILPRDTVADFRINASSPAFEFPSGKSFFKAFSLPEATAPYTLTVRSYVLNTARLDRVVLLPTVLFLDERQQIIAALQPAEFQYRDSSLASEPMDPPKFEGRIQIDPAKLKARHLVIFADLGAAGGRRVVDVPSTSTMISAGGIYVPIASRGGPRQMFASNVGSLRLFLEPNPKK